MAQLGGDELSSEDGDDDHADDVGGAYDTMGYGSIGGHEIGGGNDDDEDEDEVDSMSGDDGNGYATIEGADAPGDAEDWGDFEAADEQTTPVQEAADAEAERIASRLLARISMDYRVTAQAQADAHSATATTAAATTSLCVPSTGVGGHAGQLGCRSGSGLPLGLPPHSEGQATTGSSSRGRGGGGGVDASEQTVSRRPKSPTPKQTKSRVAPSSQFNSQGRREWQDKPLDPSASASIMSFMASLKPPPPLPAKREAQTTERAGRGAVADTSGPDAQAGETTVAALRASGFFANPSNSSDKPGTRAKTTNLVAATAVASLARAAAAAGAAASSPPPTLTPPSFGNFAAFPSELPPPPAVAAATGTPPIAAAATAATAAAAAATAAAAAAATAVKGGGGGGGGGGAAALTSSSSGGASAQTSIKPQTTPAAVALASKLAAAAGGQITAVAVAVAVVAIGGEGGAGGGDAAAVVSGGGGGNGGGAASSKEEKGDRGGRAMRRGQTLVVLDLAPPPSSSSSSAPLLLMCASSQVLGGLRGVCVCPTAAAAATARRQVEEAKMTALCVLVDASSTCSTSSSSSSSSPTSSLAEGEEQKEQEEEGGAVREATAALAAVRVGGDENGPATASDPSQVARNAARALSTATACATAHCVLVDFGDGSCQPPPAERVACSGVAAVADAAADAAGDNGGGGSGDGGTALSSSSSEGDTAFLASSSALAELAQAVATLAASLGGVTVVVRGGGERAAAAFREAVPHSSTLECGVEDFLESSTESRGEQPKLSTTRVFNQEEEEEEEEEVRHLRGCGPTRLLVLAPARPRDPQSRAAAVLEQEEDACWDADFLGSDSDVAEYPNGWICPFLPSPLSRVNRLVEFCPLTAADHLLDIGCGDGRVLVAACVAVPGLVATGVDIDQGLIRRAADACSQALGEAEAKTRCSFRVGDALARSEQGAGGGSKPSWALLRREQESLPGRRPYTVVCLFLVHAALRLVRPLVRELWEKGGVRVVTLGGYHFEDWAYDRVDFDFDVRVIDAKLIK